MLTNKIKMVDNVNIILYNTDCPQQMMWITYLSKETIIMNQSKLSIQDLCVIGLCTAVIAIMAQISIPMPMGVPMTMQTFAITLTAIILGGKKGAIASLVYVLLGAIGLPVFAGFSGGYQHLVGPTGGFLISFPLMAYVIGYAAEKRQNSKAIFVVGVTLGTLLNYVVGVLMFCLITHSGVMTGITACVLPFIPTAIIKAVVAAVVGLQIRGRLVKELSR